MNIMKQIRKGTWETNSSSTHAICIKRPKISRYDENFKLNYDKDTIHFGFDEFGWEWQQLSDTQSKANYLWTAICQLSDYSLFRTNINDWKKYIKRILNEENIQVTFEEIDYNQGYVDHAYELWEWLFELSENSSKLLAFLCDNESVILTGNDNEEDEEINQLMNKYENDDTFYFYYKGN